LSRAVAPAPVLKSEQRSPATTSTVLASSNSSTSILAQVSSLTVSLPLYSSTNPKSVNARQSFACVTGAAWSKRK
jgi:hypothetical protein